MSSTYSELKFELMGTGEQSGTWGAKTNTNLGTAINEAIANLAPVDTGSTDYTFTWTNTNTTQAARHFGLNLYTTGSHGSPYNVNVPAIQKPYMVNNSSGATATVKISGGAGVAVPNNKTTMVYANGANVVPMFNYMPDLTLDTLSVGTAIPMASGGTGSASIASGVVVSNGSLLSNVTQPSGDLVGTSSTQTLTNKSIQARVYQTISTPATLNPATDSYDMFILTSQSSPLNIAVSTGTPFNGQKIIFRITANATFAITFATTTNGYRGVGVSLPTSLDAGYTLYLGCIFNSNDVKWDVVAVNVGA
jgi:hypothetical protein